MKCNKLSITKAEFKELYPYGDVEIFFRKPESDAEFEDRYLTNKLWRLNNLYSIVDKFGNRIPLIMNKAQHIVYSKSLLHARLLILKSRQQGISTFWLISFFDDTLWIDHLSSGLMSQGRDESSTLLTRVKTAWDYLDPIVVTQLEQGLDKDNADEVSFHNKSTIFIRTSFRSATLQRLHVSEYGKICNKFPERAKETKTGTLQAIAPGNTCVIESTAEGVNDFKHMWDKDYGKLIKALGPKEFACIFLSWLNDPDCVSPVDRIATEKQQKYFDEAEQELNLIITQEQRNFWIDQYEELGEAIYQEYPMTPNEAFKAVRDGSYYGALYQKHIAKKGKIIPQLYDHNLEVEVFVDLGMNDDFVLGYVQNWQGEDRIVKEYKNSGEGIAHYVEHMFNTGYEITRVYLPHDAEVRELSTGKSRVDRFRELGVTNVTVLPKIPLQTGIELVRKLIPNLVIDKDCTYLRDCFMNYSKEWDEKGQVWKDKPVHNEFSHGADMIRYLAMRRKSKDITIHDRKAQKGVERQVVDGMAI